MKRVLLLFVLVLGFQHSVLAQKTLKVWIVRHAEKDISNPAERDPDLTQEGYKRAEALMKTLKSKKIDSIFSTDYKRTKLTGFPLADRIGIAIQTYDPTKATALISSLKNNAADKSVLIIGHSDTILELIEVLGVKRPVEAIADDEYDYLFSLTVKGDKVDVKTDKYGAKSKVE